MSLHSANKQPSCFHDGGYHTHIRYDLRESLSLLLPVLSTCHILSSPSFFPLYVSYLLFQVSPFPTRFLVSNFLITLTTIKIIHVLFLCIGAKSRVTYISFFFLFSFPTWVRPPRFISLELYTYLAL
ncbi:hypothetical protein QBC43DRAFT_308119 [Cladorrhinum sp. PSN259]|nr:hypothetical protein QBC43DRAFT_308119 [Cladorrhinum sp. PSN259]